ncbi:hypothetical protein GIB67_003187 [Kingdonia uniflora]|uniref:Uncharacterized protein n=1 Tax=Kingdonia uniflora TaxID=39325 RepID=A0A7J7NCW2_9MAGN|nr:hypothetical protein GIB67_003187 [Kingdonia uniflora]
MGQSKATEIESFSNCIYDGPPQSLTSLSSSRTQSKQIRPKNSKSKHGSWIPRRCIWGLILSHAAYATIQYRGLLKILEEEFSGPPMNVVAELLVGLFSVCGQQ